MESRIPFLNNWVRLLTFYRRLTDCKTPLQEVREQKVITGGEEKPLLIKISLYTFLSLNGLTIKKERIIIINKKNWAGK